MMKVKKNVITEINRIHQLMGTKEVIFEQRKILTPLLQVAQEIVEFAAKKDLDGVTRNTISQLQTGFKNVLDSKGNRIPLEAKDYVKIFDNLSKSSNPEIVAKLAQVERKIVTGIRENISELVDNSDVKTLIQKYIDQGGTEEFVTKQFADLFKKEYGRYANVGTVGDGDGNVLKELIDDYLEGIRKVYVDLGGKLDGVIDDVTTPIIDGGNTSSSTNYPTIPEGTFDNAGRIVSQSSPFNISRTLADLNPSLFRKLSLMFRGLGEYFGNGQTVRNRVLDNTMYLDTRVFPDGTKVTDENVLALRKQIKSDLDKIYQINEDYVYLLRKSIEEGKKTTSGAVVGGKQLSAKEVRKVWEGIELTLNKVEKDFGQPGFALVAMPNAGQFLFLKEAFLHANAGLFNLVRVLQRRFWTNKALLKDMKDGLLEMETTEIPKNITSPLKGLSRFVQQFFVPGSSRGIPRQLAQDSDLKTVPGAYDKIQKYYKKFPKLMAWSSLFSEKLILLTEIAVVSNMILGSRELYKFYQTDKENIQKKYGDCVEKTAEWMRENDVTIDKNVEKFSGTTVPECFKEILLKADDNTLKEFIIRTEFFRKRMFGIPYSELINNFLIRDGLKEIGFDILPRLFTGQLLNLTQTMWFKYAKPEYDSQISGDNTPLEGELERLREELRIVQANVERQAAALDSTTIQLPNISNPINNSDTTNISIPIRRDTTVVNPVPLGGNQ